MAFLELNVLNNADQPILGIDLGTTNSLAAVWRDGRPVILRTEDHSGSVASAVHFTEEGETVVGRAARNRALVHPEGTIFSFKRFMGRGLEDVQEDLKNVPFEASANENGVIQFHAGDKRVTPEQLSALVLQRVLQIACHDIPGQQLTRAVITVPAYFDDAQRQATRDAAKLIGLEAVRIINEPTAASLAYGLDQRNQGTIAVYDLGGGTFDISILSIEDGVFRVLSTAGDTHLGGDDLDRRLVDMALQELSGKLDRELLDDPAFRQGLRLAAEKCKIELSHRPLGDFHVLDADNNLNWRHPVKRAEFDGLIRPLVDRTLDACRQALSDADLEASDIDEVVLVGGSTRVPLVRERVEEFFGRVPHSELNPDEVVALGAAIQAHILAGGTRDILLMDVTPLSLGIETMGGAVAKIVHRNSPIPCRHSEGFTTHVDNQTGIDFNILQGERELASDCRSLGRFKLTGIPPMPAGLARVGVTFMLDASGMLKVTAKEHSTGVQASIEVQPKNNLTDAQVEQMLKASFDHAQEDFDQRRVADLRVELETMCRAAEKNLDSVRSELDPETLDDIARALEAAHRVVDGGGSVDEVQRVRRELEQATLPLAALLMDRVAKTALAGKDMSEV